MPTDHPCVPNIGCCADRRPQHNGQRLRRPFAAGGKKTVMPMALAACALPRHLLSLALAGLASLGCVVAQAAVSAPVRADLVSLYNSTNGPGWSDQTNWNSGDPCDNSWHGITCDPTNTEVVAIGLDTNNLVGSINSLASLTSLQSVDIGANQLSGSLGFLNGLPNLQRVVAYDNLLTGPLPDISTMAALRRFEVTNNQLSGPIPQLDALASLQYLLLANNQLTGSIPALAGLGNLREFAVEENRLTGSIPSLAGLTSLQLLQVNGNQLTGPIPPLSDALLLQELMVERNQLTGSLPSLNGLIHLALVRANDNQLTGAIPTLAGLTGLEILHLHNNQLTGSFPALGGLNALTEIRVSGNRLTGPISPPPGSLVNGASRVCAPTHPGSATTNDLDLSGDPAVNSGWNAATGLADWNAACRPPVAGPASPAPIPTLSQWGLMALSWSLALLGIAGIRRRPH